MKPRDSASLGCCTLQSSRYTFGESFTVCCLPHLLLRTSFDLCCDFARILVDSPRIRKWLINIHKVLPATVKSS
jgi:hypothetical protein